MKRSDRPVPVLYASKDTRPIGDPSVIQAPYPALRIYVPTLYRLAPTNPQAVPLYMYRQLFESETSRRPLSSTVKSVPNNHANALRLVAFCCANCSPKAAPLSKAPFDVDGVTVRLGQLACSSKIQIIHILQALENGADAVALWTCPHKACRFGRGSLRALKRIDRARRILDEIKLGPERVFCQELDPNDSDALDDALKTTAEQLTKLGKSPLNSLE